MRSKVRRMLHEGVRLARQMGTTGHPVRLAERYFHLYFRRHLSPDEIHFYRLLDPALPPDALRRFTGKEELLALQGVLNDRRFHHWTEDKLAFHARCAQAGLPIPALVAALSIEAREHLPAPIVARPDEFVAIVTSNDGRNLIVKPTQGVHGVGVMRLRKQGATWVDSDNAPFTVAAFETAIKVSGYRSWLAEECIAGHPSLRELSGTDTLQTYRIVTLVNKRLEPMVLCAQLRLVGGNNDSDNFSGGTRGNLIAAIDTRSGRIVSVVAGVGADPAVTSASTHPITQRNLIGFVVPAWTEAVRLAERAAKAFYPLATIGWDIAASEHSVVLIEGNVTWDPSNSVPEWPHVYAALAQQAAKISLAKTREAAMTSDCRGADRSA